MPTGELNPTTIDPATGAALLPGVILDDDFSTNRLSAYVTARTNIAGNVGTQGMVVANGQLSAPAGPHTFRNQKQFTQGRVMWSIIPGNSASFQVDSYVKYIDNANWLLVEAYQTSAQILVYQSVGGVVTNLGATISRPGPPGSTAFEPVWYVARFYITSGITIFKLEYHAYPPGLGFGANSSNTFAALAPILGTPGYAGLGFDGVVSDFTVGEWTVVDNTNRSIF